MKRDDAMEVKKYGNAPFNVAVIHGGPGAGGEMMPVAKRLGHTHGVLEPFQKAYSISGQCDELKRDLEKEGDLPVTLIGYSWGALLSFIFAATYPDKVKKLILVSSAVFHDSFASAIMSERFKRCTVEEKQLLQRLMEEKNEETFSQLGALLSKIDSYDPLPNEHESLPPSYERFEKVWKEAQELRKSGKLLELGPFIRCPVVAIHGDYDPHPAEGVREPLSRVLKDFRFFLLEHCGHTPWLEREAKEVFFHLLEKELQG